MATVLRQDKAFVASAQFISHLQCLIFGLERQVHTVAATGEDRDNGAQRSVATAPDCPSRKGDVDTTTWKPFDSIAFGIRRTMIASPIWTVLRVLRNKGFESYLVGGCVRDLVLRRTPKDFDVVTTATLTQIKKGFRRSRIVGRKFPICHVVVQGSTIEVSSFETTSEDIKKKERIRLSDMPCNCDERNFLLWKNSMQRDFTINSLFYDPLSEKLYDYAGGLTDLKMSKLRTLMPAHLLFKEDCARILRGIRIAARLRLSFSKDTEAAIWELSSSIVNLKKDRLMMELNFMLSYGAAEPSLFLLKKFRLLEILLPVHAAYLAQFDEHSSVQRSTMLMKLFLNMDKLLACDRPTNHILWVALLAFHLALISKSQKAHVIWAFSSVLYHGKWEKAVDFARENFQTEVGFIPEILEPSEIASDELLREEVAQFASLVKDSVNILTGRQPLSEILSRYDSSPCSGLFFIGAKTGKTVSILFDDLERNIKFYDVKRSSSKIDHKLLAKGNLEETRFVLGKVIMDTMCSWVSQAPPQSPHPPMSPTEEMMETQATELDNVQNFIKLPRVCNRGETAAKPKFKATPTPKAETAAAKPKAASVAAKPKPTKPKPKHKVAPTPKALTAASKPKAELKPATTAAKLKPKLKIAPTSKAMTAAANVNAAFVVGKPKPPAVYVKPKPLTVPTEAKMAAELKPTAQLAKAAKTSANASLVKETVVANKSISGLSSLFM